MEFSAIVAAAGSGSRSGGPKQWRDLGGRPVLAWSVGALLDAGAAEVVVVVPPGEVKRAEQALADLSGWTAVEGGADRAASVRAGMAALTRHDLPLLVHDAARPLLDRPVIERLLEALADNDAALPALPVPDTLKRAEGARVVSTESREALHRAQTPQAFRPGALQSAYALWEAVEPPTDEARVAEVAGLSVALVPGDPRLMKLTYPEDFAVAEALIAPSSRRRTRIGQGYDVHAFGPGDTVWLCGVAIPHTQTLVGHSDADAGLHALTDALLGALGEGDIGDHFPPSDPQWKGAASDRFLLHAVEMLRARGGEIVNADVTLICERPKVGPHRLAMRQRLAALLGAPLDAVSVKATTSERLGFTGREEGLAAMAVVSIEI
ncbi:bifunctional 2-C-methyl-D-erythritol 4-phosphate cytidylyltransferase/2-C-methyl-D-erythritol 2,4-cyclodiphosphate synthase [Brevundimonas lutea]|uniref:bifunctional 2-C-methyl-D-erythritol 4-phosphate cytidylyltransferase/2-C-methyl-D-erythritol 2,4-cyclodiphosphate synthase n=1 Tax=Brevundimonas lutea TaxID=2293980 RepID=UPI000F028261|nr:bifunctional 2-C-methyl-D-erythritol 4-phosphate cytidylyltransferase/2-C-methyl-D-erythritol 2,4-cyclodiphosphate synthase [Brevundimonas lutea]